MCQAQCNLLVWFLGAQYSANCGVTYIYGPPVSEWVRACVLSGMEVGSNSGYLGMPAYQLFHRATSRSVGGCRAIAISLGWCLCLPIMSRSSNDVCHITYSRSFHLRMSRH